MAFIVKAGLDILFLVSALWMVGTTKKLTKLAKSFLLIPVSLLAGDALTGLGYTGDFIEMGYTMAWVFSAIITLYLYTLEKGKPRRELLNLGGAVIFSPVLLFIGKDVNFPLLLCYGAGALVFSVLLFEEEMKASGAFGTLACSILFAMSLSQILWKADVEETITILPRVILLVSLAIFGYVNLAKPEMHRETPDLRAVLRLKEERRAIRSEIQAMLNELKRIKGDKSGGKIDGVYKGLKSEYNREIALLGKSASRKLEEMRGMESQIRSAVEDGKKELARLKKELQEEERNLRKVNKVVSGEIRGESKW